VTPLNGGWRALAPGGAGRYAPPIDGSLLLNRELSWLDFNARVLEQARVTGVPPLERAKFLAIVSSNLDEFFQVRVAALKDQVAAGVPALSPDGRTAAQQLAAIVERVRRLVADQERVFLNEVGPVLADEGIELLSWADLDDDERKVLAAVFEQRVLPVLTPLAVDPSHPFPYLSNLSLNLAVMVRHPDTRERRFARVKVPALVPRWTAVPGTTRFVPLEQVVAAHLHLLFPGMTIEECWFFRVTRNADLTLEDEEADDLLEAVEMELRRRRFRRPVRLEVQAGISDAMLHLLLDELDLWPDDVTHHEAPLDLSGFWALHAVERPALKDEPWPSSPPPALQAVAAGDRSIFSVLRERDVLVHHPYDSFASSVEHFIEAAARDPNVRSIKMTLYRTSTDSPILEALVDAAERGVQVAVLVELKARFDEEANITWARRLERSGVHVVYGVVGLKTHAKCVLVVREELDGFAMYAHVGTGNYNSRTARVYEDLGLLTADDDVCNDLSRLFNHLTGFSRPPRFDRIVVAPEALRPHLVEHIRHEKQFGDAGRISIKVNAVTDPVVIEELYLASQAGVRIDLFVRGICCLRPGVPGVSDTIRVRSALGRYLEHSRVYRFAHGEVRPDGSVVPLYLIGSADLMQRNLDRRVEVVVSLHDPGHGAVIDHLLALAFDESTTAWVLDSDGVWHQHQGRYEYQTRVNNHLSRRRRA
jgi:polyphosphate kinase